MGTPDTPRSSVEAIPDAEVGVGVYARDATGAVLAAVRPDRPRAPASNTKLLTTAIALDRLGPDHRFRVHARRDGAGRLVLRGDRTLDLTAADLERVADAVAAAGIDSLAGVVVDPTPHDRQPYGPGWTWGDEEYAYGARCSPIAVEGNVVAIEIAADATGVETTVVPASDAVPVETDLATDPEADPDGGDLEAYRDHETGVVRVEGTLPPDAELEVTAPVGDPLEHAGAVMARTLARTGVDLEGPVTVADGSGRGGGLDAAEPITTVTSAPLGELVADINRPSDNFMAEQLARAVAGHEGGADSWAAWQSVVADALEELDAGPARIRDGSGLSRYNRIAPRDLVRLLEWAQGRPWGETFIASLPVAGESGTLSDRLADREATIRAKTGTLTGTRALSGVIDRDGGAARITFSVLLGDLAGDHEAAGHDYVDAALAELLDGL